MRNMVLVVRLAWFYATCAIKAAIETYICK